MDKRNISNILPLTFTQEGMLYHTLKDQGENSNYVEVLNIYLDGDIDHEIIQKAWIELIDRTDALRTVYRWQQLDHPVQIILKKTEPAFYTYDLSDKPEDMRENEANEIVGQDIRKGFNLSDEVPLRIYFFRLSRKKGRMIVISHHILFDGWSNGLILRQFLQLYDAIREHRRVDDIRSVGSCRVLQQFIQETRNAWNQGAVEFWNSYFEEFLYPTYLSDHIQRSQPRVKTIPLEFTLPADRQGNMEAFIKATNSTKASFFYLVWGLLLQDCLNTNDVVFGTTDSGRALAIPELFDTVGMFINTIPFRFNEDPRESAQNLIDKVKKNLMQRRPFETNPLAEIQKIAGTHTGFFNTIVVLEDYPVDQMVSRHVKITGASVNESNHYDLTLSIIPAKYNRIRFHFSFDNRVLDEEYVNWIFQHMLKIMERLSAEPPQTMMTNSHESLIETPSITEILMKLTEDSAGAPAKPAMRCGEKQLTYEQLGRKSDVLASSLSEFVSEKALPIGLLMQYSIDLPVAVLGILKSGNTPVFLDPNWPEDYKKQQMQAMALIITEEPVRFSCKFSITYQNLMNAVWGMIPVSVSPYSRSNGNTVNEEIIAVQALQKRYPLTSQDVVYYAAPYDCHSFIWDMIWCLSNMATFCFTDIHKAGSEEVISDIICSDASILRTTPEFLEQFLMQIDEDFCVNETQHIQSIMIDNLFLSKQLIQLHDEILQQETGCRLIGLHGYHNGFFYMEKLFDGKNDYTGELLLSSKHLHLLDRYGRLLGPCRLGELYVGGSRNEWKATGDTAIWTSGGQLLIVDTQFRRIAGHYIDTREISAAVKEYEGIQNCETYIHDENGRSFIVNYFTAENEINIQELQLYIECRLPDFEQPDSYIQISEIENLRKKHREQVMQGENGMLRVDVPDVAPQNPIERKIWEIWTKAIGKECGIHHNFFDAGGNSLSILQVNGQITKEFQIQLPLSVMFQKLTISTLAQYVRHQMKIPQPETVTDVAEEISGYIEDHVVGRAEEPSGTFPVSYAQSQLLLHGLITGENTIYNIPIALQIEGDLDEERFIHSFKKLIQRHAALRTSFQENGDTFIQCIETDILFELRREEISSGEIRNATRRFIRPFTMNTAPLLHAELLRITDRGYYLLLLDMSHCISDLTSYQILLNDLGCFYSNEELLPLKAQYTDFVQWQRQSLEEGVLKKQQKYWHDRFRDGVPDLYFPYDKKRPNVTAALLNSVTVVVESELKERIFAITRQTETTPFMLLLAIFHIDLFLFTREEVVVTGTPAAGRRHPEFENVIGNFINMLPILTHIDNGMTFLDYLESVKKITIDAFSNQDYPFGLMQKQIRYTRNQGRHPVFDFVFTYIDKSFEAKEILGLAYTITELDRKLSKYDLLLTAEEQENQFKVTWEYRTDLFVESTVQKISERFIGLIEAVTANPDKPIHQMIQQSDRIDLSENEDRNPTINSQFNKQVIAHPYKTALIDCERRWTYTQLDQYADRVASVLITRGGEAGSVIGVLLDRSLETAGCFLGVLKAGGVYMPIDPHYPKARIRYMLEDSGLQILLTRSEYEPLFEGEAPRSVIYIDELCQSEETVPFFPPVSPQQAAYIIYTSGSTGNPKGCIINHQNVVRLLFQEPSMFNFSEADTWSISHSFCFDFSVWELYGALLYGGTGVIVSKNTVRDPSEFWNVLIKNKVTVLNQTPGGLRNLLNEWDRREIQGLCLRYIILGGEKLSPIILMDWHRQYPDIKIINMYGITETTVHVTYKEISEADIQTNQSNIGTPLPDLSIVLLDADLQPVLNNEIGEMFISGPGLGRGYLNRPELTNERFIDNPNKPGQRLYRSGDYAMRSVKGDLIYQGRIDKQVEVNGHRIETAEIESVICKYTNVKETVVCCIAGDNEQTTLYAFLVSSTKVTAKEIRSILADYLPEYMIPQHYVSIDSIPLNANGKVDLNQLEEMAVSPLDVNRDEDPADNPEDIMCRLWMQVLRMSALDDVDINFFDLGGDSSSLIALRVLIEKQWSVKIPVKDLFANPTVRQMTEMTMSRL